MIGKAVFGWFLGILLLCSMTSFAADKSTDSQIAVMSQAEKLFWESLDMDNFGKSSKAQKKELRLRVVVLEPNAWYGHFCKSWLAGQDNDLETEESELMETIKLKPDFAEAYDNLGVVKVNQGNSGEAVKNFKKAIKLKPMPFTYNNLGVVAWNEGDLITATSNFRMAIRLRPEFGDPYINMGSILLDKEDFFNNTLSLLYFLKAHRYIPDFGLVEMRIGSLYSKVGLKDIAVSALEAALVLAPDDQEIAQQLERVRGEERQPVPDDKQISEFNRILKSDPINEEALKGVIIGMLSKKKEIEAIAAVLESYFQRKDLDQEYGFAHFLLEENKK